MLGYALVDPNSGAPGASPPIEIPAEQRTLLRPDVLVLFGARSPVKQGPVQNPTPRKGVRPRYGTAVVEADGMIRVANLSEGRSHYFAPTASGGQAHIFQNTTTTITRKLPYTDVRVWTPDGRPVAASVLPQWLNKEYAVLISGDGNEVDPAFLQLLRPNTPIIAVPTPMPRGPAQAPPH